MVSSHVLLSQVNVNVGIMVMKRCYTLLKSPDLEPHH